MGLVVLVLEGDKRGDRTATLSLSCGTDSRGNAYLLDQMITTKYPLVVIWKELAQLMRRRRFTLREHWLRCTRTNRRTPLQHLITGTSTGAEGGG